MVLFSSDSTFTLCGLMLWPVAWQCSKTAEVSRDLCSLIKVGPGGLAIVIFFIIYYTGKYSPKSFAKDFRTKRLCQSRWKNLFVTFLQLSSVYLLICWTYRLDNCVKFESSPGGKTEMAFEDKSLRGQKKAYSVKCRTYQMKAFFELIFHRISSVSVSVRVHFSEIN